MAEPRKKWRLRLVPSLTYLTKPSMKRAYVEVAHRRALWDERMSNVHQVDVEVDEGNGWVLFERVVFPERDGTI